MISKAGEKKFLDYDALIWIQTSFIGDVILTTGALKKVSEVFPSMPQLLVTTPLAAKALKGQTWIDSLIAWDKKQDGFKAISLAIKKDLTSRGIRRPVILQAHRSTRSSILTKFLGFPVITYDEASMAFGKTRKLARVACMHEAQRIALLAEPLGMRRDTIVDAKPYLVANQKHLSSEIAADLEKESGKFLIGVAPGSVWATKRWLVERFSEMALRLSESLENIQIVLIGSKAEIPLGEKMMQDARDHGKAWLNLIGKSGIEELPYLYSRLGLLVSNDSSPIHYASAMKVPTLAIFGATCSSMGFGPLAPDSRVVEVSIDELSCRPCSDHGPKKCPLGHFRCMKDISVSTVVAEILKMPPISGRERQET